MLVHPVTMDTMGIAIATTVLIECGRVTVCRVWPCLSLPLDGGCVGGCVICDACVMCASLAAVIGVGTGPLLSLQCDVGGGARMSPLLTRPSSVVAGRIQLEPLSE